MIKFNEAKNLVIFEGSEGSLAELNRILIRGQEPETIKAEKITYNRQTGEFETKGTSHYQDRRKAVSRRVICALSGPG